jgi:hypothetical protein
MYMARKIFLFFCLLLGSCGQNSSITARGISEADVTTILEEVLAALPELAPAARKEIEYAGFTVNVIPSWEVTRLCHNPNAVACFDRISYDILLSAASEGACDPLLALSHELIHLVLAANNLSQDHVPPYFKGETNVRGTIEFLLFDTIMSKHCPKPLKLEYLGAN